MRRREAIITELQRCNWYWIMTLETIKLIIPRVVFTKAPFVDFPMKHIFKSAKVSVRSDESHLYLTGVTAAKMKRHMSNMSVIFTKWPMFWGFWKKWGNTDTVEMGLVMLLIPNPILSRSAVRMTIKLMYQSYYYYYYCVGEQCQVRIDNNKKWNLIFGKVST